VREFLECAFGLLELDPYKYLVLDERFLRPAEVDVLLGDAAKAREHLGWSPQITFRELVRDMVFSDLNAYSRSASGSSTADPLATSLAHQR
jgi:GDPmannose 4,6-dehydratase